MGRFTETPQNGFGSRAEPGQKGEKAAAKANAKAKGSRRRRPSGKTSLPQLEQREWILLICCSVQVLARWSSRGREETMERESNGFADESGEASKERNHVNGG
jgi:hypothetical protein